MTFYFGSWNIFCLVSIFGIGNSHLYKLTLEDQENVENQRNEHLAVTTIAVALIPWLPHAAPSHQRSPSWFTQILSLGQKFPLRRPLWSQFTGHWKSFRFEGYSDLGKFCETLILNVNAFKTMSWQQTVLSENRKSWDHGEKASDFNEKSLEEMGEIRRKFVLLLAWLPLRRKNSFHKIILKHKYYLAFVLCNTLHPLFNSISHPNWLKMC